MSGRLRPGAIRGRGLEDNVRLDKNTLAPSNAALIQRAAEICEKYERPVATWRQTREILNLQIEA